MGYKRSIVTKKGPGAAGASEVISLGVPSWARAAIVHVKATTAAASTYDVSITLDSGDTEGTAITLVAADQIAASATDAQRYLAIGEGVVTLAGTNVDSVGLPLSKRAALTLTASGTVSDVDIEVEFLG